MNILNWLGWKGSVRRRAMSSYKRGLARTKNNDSPGAMLDFTAAIELGDAPADVRGMALYNRALLFAAGHDARKANDDLQALLAIDAALPEIKLAARRRLERIRNRSIVDTAAHGVQNASNNS